MGVSAPDVITYVGVPLAVLGVLPILWTALKTLLLSYQIRNELSKNLDAVGLRMHVTTNTDILSGQVTVIYDRVRLRPIPTAHESYGRLIPVYSRSKLRGGSWTILRWDMDVSDWWEAAPSKYTLTPSDHLRQPAARINFASLISVLLDLDTVVYPEGVKKLNADESRTVPGTVLLKTRSGSPVLSISSLDSNEESETLGLKLHWSGVEMGFGNSQGKSSAQRKWLQITPALKPRRALRTRVMARRNEGKIYSFVSQNSNPIDQGKQVRGPNGRTWPISAFQRYQNSQEMIDAFEMDLKPDEAGWEYILDDPGEDTDEQKWTDPLRHAQSKMQRKKRLQDLKSNWETPSNFLKSKDVMDPALFCVDLNLDQPLIELYFEHSGIQQAHLIRIPFYKFIQLDVRHLQPSQMKSEIESRDKDKDNAGEWLSSFVKALATRSQVLCKYSIPLKLINFAQESYKLKPTIPCGVLLELKLISQEDCIKWKPEDAWAIFMDQSQNSTYSTSWGKPTFNHLGPHPKLVDQNEIKEQVSRNQIPHALQSPLWPVAKVADLLTVWLRQEFEFEEEDASPIQIAEWTLHRMLLYPAEAKEVARMLNKWQAWGEYNTLVEADYNTIKGHKTTFALAACLLSVLGEYANSADVHTEYLLDECLAKWDDVLLG
ncbi:hypothetical protein MMC14_010188 [Varicellaria rhodocarpa]|nr:hypothetical protein [Varicellaria rhodocarpa]